MESPLLHGIRFLVVIRKENMGIKIIDEDELRKRLKAIIRKYPDTQRKLAKAMAISTPTLMKFLQGTKSPDFTRLCRIEDWVIKKEKNENIA